MIRHRIAIAAAVLTLGFASPALSQAPTLPPAPPPQAQPAPLPQTQPAAPPPSQQLTPDTPSSAPPSDSLGEEVTLVEKPIVYFKGSGTWDSAFDTIVDAFKTVNGFLDKQGIKPAGPPMTIYTATDDSGFQFNAAVPVAEAPKDPPRGDIAVGTSPSGKAYKFIHRGSYDSMDSTYEAITNFLDEKQIDAKDLFVEQYMTDPVTTPEDRLVVEIYVPVR
jgi:effector-binding domain-containing protein